MKDIKKYFEEIDKKVKLAYSVANKARKQGFRKAIVSLYDHRCALCGIRLLTPEGHTVVEAAHIIPWSETQDDSPINGMALCKVCHWSFDEGKGSSSFDISNELEAKINGATWAAGKKGGALEFDGKDDFLKALGKGMVVGHRTNPMVHFGSVWARIKKLF